jgi:UDP-2-acetamido-3-amino-2,3-dideoxy-glucuronate N-acetyltransferase
MGSQSVAVIGKDTMIHPLAHVDVASCMIGDRTKIWQFASLTRGLKMGSDCSVSPHCMMDGSEYGNRVIISGGFKAGAGFKIGSDVFIAPNVTLCNDLWPSADKDGYDDAMLRSGERFAVIIEDDVVLGAGCVVLPGVRIEKGSVIAAGAVVNKNIPAGVVFHRSGKYHPKPEGWRENRMRWAS